MISDKIEAIKAAVNEQLAKANIFRTYRISASSSWVKKGN